MLKLITPAPEEAVNLDQFKAHLHGVAESDDDADLTVKLIAAREYIEDTECRGRALITSTWVLTLPHWPGMDRCGRSYIVVPLGNLQEIEGITYRIPGGQVLILDPSRYVVERVYTPANLTADPPITGDGVSDCGLGRVYLGYSKVWPATVLDVGEPISITFKCGWDSAAHVPFSLRAAILLAGATLYRNRESVFVGRSEVAALMKLATDASAIRDLCSKYAAPEY